MHTLCAEGRKSCLYNVSVADSPLLTKSQTPPKETCLTPDPSCCSFPPGGHHPARLAAHREGACRRQLSRHQRLSAGSCSAGGGHGSFPSPARPCCRTRAPTAAGAAPDPLFSLRHGLVLVHPHLAVLADCKLHVLCRVTPFSVSQCPSDLETWVTGFSHFTKEPPLLPESAQQMMRARHSLLPSAVLWYSSSATERVCIQLQHIAGRPSLSTWYRSAAAAQFTSRQAVHGALQPDTPPQTSQQIPQLAGC